MVSDHSQFTIRVSGAFCAAFSATVSLTSGYHPQPNGQVEHANQSLESTLRCVTACHPTMWSSWLPWVEYAHNSKVSAVLGMRLHCGTSHPCSTTRRRRSLSRPSRPTSTAANESGDRCVRLFCVLLPRSRGQQTARRRSLRGGDTVRFRPPGPSCVCCLLCSPQGVPTPCPRSRTPATDQLIRSWFKRHGLLILGVGSSRCECGVVPESD